MVDKLLEYFEFTSIINVPEMVDKFNIFINASREEKMDLCFQLFDNNDDDIICMKDIMDLMNLIHTDDYYI